MLLGERRNLMVTQLTTGCAQRRNSALLRCTVLAVVAAVAHLTRNWRSGVNALSFRTWGSRMNDEGER